MSIFKFRSEHCKRLERKKLTKKNGIICLVSMFFSWVMVLKLSKKVHFLQFCTDLTKFNSIEAIYTYASQRSPYTLSENGIVYNAMIYCFGDIRAWSWRISLNFCRFSIFNILITNISWTVAQTPINHTIFSKNVVRTFRCIYEICFNWLRFLAELSTKL